MAERRNRSAAEKAVDALDTHERKITRIDQSIAHQREVLANYEAQRAGLDSRHVFLLRDPDLPADRKQQGYALRTTWLETQPQAEGTTSD